MTPEESIVMNINEATGAADGVYEFEEREYRSVMRIKLAMCIIKTAFAVKKICEKTPVDELGAYLLKLHVTKERIGLLLQLIEDHYQGKKHQIPEIKDLLKIMKSNSYIALLEQQAHYSNIRFLAR